MSIVADSVVIVAQACEVAGGNGLGDQYVNPTGGCRVSAFHVQLSLAGGITDPFHLIFKVLMTITWAIYQFQVIGLAWVTDFVLGMTWLDWFTGIVSGIQDSVAGMLANLNIYLTMLMVSAFVCVVWMARGMWGKGIVQLLISLIVANYALAAISYDREHPENSIVPFNPVAWIIGNDEDGLLYDARDTARYLVGTITNDDDYIEDLDDPADNVVTPGQSVLNAFLYHPAMLINFGYILDGECEEAYVVTLSHAGNGSTKEALKNDLQGLSGQGSAADGVDTGSALTDPGTWWGGTGDQPVDYDPEVWKVVGSCLTDNVDAFAKMARPDSWMAQFAIQPAVTILAVLILIIAGVVFIAGMSALVQCVKLLVTLMLAILPGGARSALWRNIGQLLSTVLMLIFCIVFLGVFLHVLTDVMASGRTPTGDPSQGMVRWAEIGKFLLIDLMLVAGIVMFWRGRGAVHETRERMAAAMASKFDSGGGGGGGRGGGGFGGAGGGGGGSNVRSLSRAAGNFNAANDMARMTGSRERFGGVIRRTSGLAGKVGTAWATGGGSVVAKGGAMAARSYTGRAVSDKIVNKAGQSVEYARRMRVKGHLKHGDFASAHRISTQVRRSESSRAARMDRARLRKFDRQTRRAEVTAKITRGRRGAEWVNTAPENRKRLVKETDEQRSRMAARHKAERAAERSRLTPDERRLAEERERKSQQRELWREARRKAKQDRSGRRPGRPTNEGS